MRYHIKIFGCQMNYSDAERISAILGKYKLKQAASTDEADLVIFVTCGVRQSAEDRAYGQINNLRKKYPDKKIILTGCLAHRKDVQRRLKNKVDLFCEIKNFPDEIVSVIASAAKQSRVLQNRSRLLRHYVPRNDKKGYLKIYPKYTHPYTAYVPIMTGCNNFCTYCVVPYARGREYSRSAEDILKEVKNLVKKGCKEIVLLGQNVNSYKSNSVNFPELLRIIDNIPGNFWLTFLTSHPKDMSDELIEIIAKSKKICEYVSLPAQSGDNEILRRMNRKYTIEHYKDLIKKIRTEYKKYKPNNASSISTDIIVGFPGETKKQFENTEKFLREMKFDMVYISQYSPRPETAALKMKDNISKKEKVRREKTLTSILAKTAFVNNKKYVGRTVEVLVDADLSLRAQRSPPASIRKAFRAGNPAQLENTGSLRSLRSLAMTSYSGHTRTQKKVIFHSSKKIPVGNFVKVRIIKAKAFGLEGEIELGPSIFK